MKVIDIVCYMSKSFKLYLQTDFYTIQMKVTQFEPKHMIVIQLWLQNSIFFCHKT